MNKFECSNCKKINPINFECKECGYFSFKLKEEDYYQAIRDEVALKLRDIDVEAVLKETIKLVFANRG